MWWKEAPFARLTVWLIAGFVLYAYYPGLPVAIPACLFGFSSILWVVVSKIPHYFIFRFPIIRALLIQFAIVNVAYLLAFWHHSPNHREWYKKYSASYDYVLVRIAEDIQRKPRSIKSFIEIQQLVSVNSKQKVIGKALAYFKLSARSQSLRHGDIILIRNRFKPIRSNSNPGGFDYSKWCKQQQVFESVYLQDQDWQPTALHQDDIFSYCGRLGLWTRKVLRRNISEPSALGIAEALLIGYREDIDTDIWQAYSRTGIVHIIAISGMHMVLVYGSMRWILSLLPFLKRNHTAIVSISLIIMWMFALLTGMPASVARAAVMLTFVGMGEVLKRDVFGLNNLCASGFVLMCFNPNLLFDVGFQLSFIAVLSLLLFQQSVYQLLTFKQRIADWIWQLTAVTISAQVLTFPICVYYFHQFPLLFLVTNLVAIPLTTVLLYIEILLLFVASLDSLATPLGSLIGKGILMLNVFLQRVGEFDFAVWSGLQISIVQMALFYLLIALIFSWISLKKPTYLIASLLLIFVLLSDVCYDQWKLNQQMGWIVYDSRNQKYLEFIKGQNYHSPDLAGLSDEVIRYCQIPAHIFFQVKTKSSKIVSSAGTTQLEIFHFGQDTLIRLTGHRFRCRHKVKTDYLLLSDAAAPSAAFISKGFVCHQIIIDKSIPLRKAQKLAASYAPLGIPVHLVHQHGAFIRYHNH